MLVLRCTQKLLKRIGPAITGPPESTTALGDWYAGPLAIGHQRYLLLVSERSRLPVLMPGRDVKHLTAHFPEALARVLEGLGVPAPVISREIAEAGEIIVAKTASRSVLGTPNDFSYQLKWQLWDDPAPDLTIEAVRLSHTPVGPLGPGWPDEVTPRLLGCEAPRFRARRGRAD
ncbi:MAG TPA: hypothetical protein VFD50_06210 [Thermoleophilia bacterium]|nr:hypothetical protein [Thermoleophilia bacterium]